MSYPSGAAPERGEQRSTRDADSVALAVGLLPPLDWLARPAERRIRLLREIADAGIDHVAVGDHISFRDTYGFDGIVNATAVLAAEPRLAATIAVYLLPHRHPVAVARQLSTLAELAPGRLVFGVGVGGEDPHEAEICGIDNTSRGRRANEHLAVLRQLLTETKVSAHGEFVDLDTATVGPRPHPPIPFLVGGRSDAAIERTATLGDGWLGIWVSPSRFARVAAEIRDRSAAVGRPNPDRHALNVWCAFDTDPRRAESLLAEEMSQSYGIPFERFRTWCPGGPPEAVAEFLAPYRDAGCRQFNLLARAADQARIIDGVAAVREHLLR